MLCCWIRNKVALDRIDDCRLEVLGRKISLDFLKPKSFENCRDVTVLEFDGRLASIDLASKKPIVLGFVKGNASDLVVEHQKIVRDYEVKFLVGPIASFAWFL